MNMGITNILISTPYALSNPLKFSNYRYYALCGSGLQYTLPQ